MAIEGTGYESPLEFIYRTKNGRLRDLERELGRTTVRQLEAMGFIKNAPSANGDTWKLSDCARRLGEVSSRRYTRKERLKDFYRYKLPRILFGV